MESFTITSPEFAEGQRIPLVYTCDGDNINPPLNIDNTPRGTISLALIVEDPDIPTAVKEKMGIEVFDHWFACNIPPSTSEIPVDTPLGTQGANSYGGVGYTGPCPPAEHEPTEHRYIFTIYALDTTIDLDEGYAKEALRAEMAGHILETASLTGLYEKQR